MEKNPYAEHNGTQFLDSQMIYNSFRSDLTVVRGLTLVCNEHLGPTNYDIKMGRV